jgi:uncharacterized protein (DUF1697 family)
VGVYVAMLRGINVGGHKKVPMKDLALVAEGVGANDVRTYIQSGNLVLSSSLSAAPLTQALEAAIATRFGFAVPVQLRTKAQLSHVAVGNPFLKKGLDEATLHVTFLDAAPKKSAIDAISELAFAPDTLVVAGREIYLSCPEGYGNTKLHNGFFEKRLKVGATTRNWKTVVTLLEMANA